MLHSIENLGLRPMCPYVTPDPSCDVPLGGQGELYSLRSLSYPAFQTDMVRYHETGDDRTLLARFSWFWKGQHSSAWARELTIEARVSKKSLLVRHRTVLTICSVTERFMDLMDLSAAFCLHKWEWLSHLQMVIGGGRTVAVRECDRCGTEFEVEWRSVFAGNEVANSMRKYSLSPDGWTLAT
jgi:hypothetical protein